MSAKKNSKQHTDISALVVVLCNMLESWSKNPDSFPIGDIDKAVAALKKLQEIKSAEQNSTVQTGDIVINHCIPRPSDAESSEQL